MKTTRVTRHVDAPRELVYRAQTDTFHGRFVRLVPNERVVEVVEFETQDPGDRSVDEGA